MKRIELEKRLADTQNKINFDPIEHNDRTKSKIATTFVNYYFWIIIGTILVGLLHNLIIFFMTKDGSLTLSIKDLLLIITTAIGSPLGFIIGYYFKENNK